MLAAFLFMSDLNGHHRDWLGPTTTNRHGVAALDCATVSFCDKLVDGLTLTPAITVGGSSYKFLTLQGDFLYPH